MSLLNDMLKNLEQRNQGEQKVGQAEPVEAGNLQAAPTPNRWLPAAGKLMSIAVLIVGLGLSAFWLYHSWGKKRVVTASLVSVSKSKTADLMRKVAHPNAMLQNVYMTRNANEIVIQFTFDLAVHYRLVENDDHSRSMVVLNDVSFNPNLPLLPVGFIKSITAKAIGHDLQIAMETAPGTEIKIMQDQTQKPVRLIFILSNNPPPTVVPAMKKVPVPPTAEEQAASDYQQALDLIAKDHLAQAATLLMRVVKLSPEMIAARKTLVALLIYTDQIDLATGYVEAGLKITPDSIELIELKARILLLKNRPGDALQVLQGISPLLMQEPEYYALLASVQQRLGQFAIAEQIYKQLLAIDRDNATWWVGLGLALESQHKVNSAVQVYQQALDFGNLSPDLQTEVQERITKLNK